jgi:hypothetical protein
MNDLDILTKIGQFGPGFAAAGYLWLEGRRYQARIDAERAVERKEAQEREKAHHDALLEHNELLRETLSANTRAFTQFESTQAQLARAIEAGNLSAAAVDRRQAAQRGRAT